MLQAYEFARASMDTIHRVPHPLRSVCILDPRCKRVPVDVIYNVPTPVPHLYTILGQASYIASTTRSALVLCAVFLTPVVHSG